MTHDLGKKYWRSLGELQNSPEFEQFVRREFPVAASEFPEGVSRRRWLQLMGASFALAGVAGCRWETERIAPFAERPENRVPGEPQKYATAVELAGGTRPLLVTCYDGRPIKIEGNPEHPESRGATDLFAQASLLDLYDPDRSSELRRRSGRQSFRKDWDDFFSWAAAHFDQPGRAGEEGLAVLLQPNSSLAMRDMLARLRQRFPQSQVYAHAGVTRDNERAGIELAFGRALRTHFALDAARVIVCLDEDLLGQHPAAVRHARQYTERRAPDAGWMSRLYVVESQFSLTGAAADHRLAMRSSDIGSFVAALEAEIDRQAGQRGQHAGAAERVGLFVQAIAEDLLRHRGESLLAVGPRQPAEVHARIHRLNTRLGNNGKTVLYTEDHAGVGASGDLNSLVSRMQQGQVETLLILGGNPAYDAPADVEFAKALPRVGHSIHLSRYEDETSQLCEWHLPQAHPFEAWGDVRTCDGTLSVSQPLIEPLLNGKSSIEVLAVLSGDDLRDGQAIVRRSIEAAHGPLSEKAWQKLLHDGFLAGSAYRKVEPALVEPPAVLRTTTAAGNGASSEGDLELVFSPGETTYDGSFANNGWLQETPGFLTKLTWDNAAIFNPRTAEQLGVKHGTLVELESRGRRLRLPAFVLPGQAPRSIGVALGYGRTAAGSVGGHVNDGVDPVGVNANGLRTADGGRFVNGVVVEPTGQEYELATTQDHHTIDKAGLEEIGRRVGELVREGTLDEYLEHPDFARHEVHHPPLKSLWEEPSYDGHAWGMSIDLNKCIGCNACLVACQAENNVPIVGKEQVLRGREMHWIRTDRYFTGDVDEPRVAHQPVACHHCENAPCEQVCPVAATVHSDEGLNDMIYNRCVGTRYCANNCPYKVRRFNFFDYNAPLEAPGRELVQLGINPEVTVRSRGVMEKCTYCVQRIQRVKIDAKNDGRPVRDGEILTACQQVCPARAIEFGDLNDGGSRVALAHKNPRAYGLLAELNVKPRTRYLARVRNPHPLLADDETKTADREGGEHGDIS